MQRNRVVDRGGYALLLELRRHLVAIIHPDGCTARTRTSRHGPPHEVVRDISRTINCPTWHMIAAGSAADSDLTIKQPAWPASRRECLRTRQAPTQLIQQAPCHFGASLASQKGGAQQQQPPDET